MKMISFEQIKTNEEINLYIKKADDLLSAIGFTEHSFAHVGKVVDVASQKAADIEEQIDKKREIKKLEAEIEEHKNLVIQNIIIADQDEICLPANVSKHINAILEKTEYIDELDKEEEYQGLAQETILKINLYLKGVDKK